MISIRLAEQDPSNSGWQRDLSVSYEKVGDVLVVQGNLQEALDAYQQSLKIAKPLAEQDPSNAEWQRNLSVSYEKVGDVLVARSKLQEALDAYQQSIVRNFNSVLRSLIQRRERPVATSSSTSCGRKHGGDSLVFVFADA